VEDTGNEEVAAGLSTRVFVSATAPATALSVLVVESAAALSVV
jgi:hypothetical protein